MVQTIPDETGRPIIRTSLNRASATPASDSTTSPDGRWWYEVPSSRMASVATTRQGTGREGCTRPAEVRSNTTAAPEAGQLLGHQNCERSPDRPRNNRSGETPSISSTCAVVWKHAQSGYLRVAPVETSQSVKSLSRSSTQTGGTGLAVRPRSSRTAANSASGVKAEA